VVEKKRGRDSDIQISLDAEKGRGDEKKTKGGSLRSLTTDPIDQRSSGPSSRKKEENQYERGGRGGFRRSPKGLLERGRKVSSREGDSLKKRRGMVLFLYDLESRKKGGGEERKSLHIEIFKGKKGIDKRGEGGIEEQVLPDCSHEKRGRSPLVATCGRGKRLGKKKKGGEKRSMPP